MAFGDHAIEYTRRKIAGMHALLQNWAGHLEDEAKTQASWHDRTGHARQSIHSGVEIGDEEFVLYLAHGVEYGGFLEEGTKPHIIRPKEKKALYWYGASHPVKAVRHPGTKPYAIVSTTLDANISRIKKTVLEYWED